MTTNQVTNFNSEQKAKLINVIQEGIQVTDEIESLRGGLSDTIKAVAIEMDIPAGVLKKAIAVAHKSNFDDVENDHRLLETILTATGKK